jgi:hypothetical protein
MVCHDIFVHNFLTLDKCWSCRFWGWIRSAWTFDNQFEKCQLFSVEMRSLLSSASLELQLLLSSPVWIFLRPLSCTDLVVYVFYLGASSDYEISSVWPFLFYPAAHVVKALVWSAFPPVSSAQCLSLSMMTVCLIKETEIPTKNFAFLQWWMICY